MEWAPKLFLFSRLMKFFIGLYTRSVRPRRTSKLKDTESDLFTLLPNTETPSPDICHKDSFQFLNFFGDSGSP